MDSDCTRRGYDDSGRYHVPVVSPEFCPECRCAPNRPHADGCEGTAQLTSDVINAVPEHIENYALARGTNTVKDTPPDCQGYEAESGRFATGGVYTGECPVPPEQPAFGGRCRDGSHETVIIGLPEFAARIGITMDDPRATGEDVWPLERGASSNLHHGEDVVKVTEPVAQTGNTPATGNIPLWKQALWLARHIEGIRSPRPELVSDDELRGMTLVRVLGIGAEEHGDTVFRKSHEALAADRKEEWSDAEFYDLVDRFGSELR